MAHEEATSANGVAGRMENVLIENRKASELASKAQWVATGLAASMEEIAIALECDVEHEAILDAIEELKGRRHVRHKQRCSTYRVLGDGEARISVGQHEIPGSLVIAYGWCPGEWRAKPEDLQGVSLIVEGDKMTIYRSNDDGSLSLRFNGEFEDGRFEDISPRDAVGAPKDAKTSELNSPGLPARFQGSAVLAPVEIVEQVSRAIDPGYWKWADVHFRGDLPGDAQNRERRLEIAKAAIAAVRSVSLGPVAPATLPRLRGVSRDTAHSILVGFEQRLTDDDIRTLHEILKKSTPTAGGAPNRKFMVTDRVQDDAGFTGTVSNIDGDQVEVTWDISGCASDVPVGSIEPMKLGQDNPDIQAALHTKHFQDEGGD
jgi:hypothetical protein